MDKQRKNTGISEVLGTVILLGMAIGLFSVLYTVVLSYPFPSSPPSVHLYGSVNGNTITITNLGGSSLNLNTIKVILTIGGNTLSLPASGRVNDSNGDNYWGIGETFVYTTGNLANIYVSASVLDSGSNSIVMTGLLQEGNTGSINFPPVFGTPSPPDGSLSNPLSFSWSIPINDPEGNSFTWSIQCSNGQTNSGFGASNGTKSLALSGLAYDILYRVWVNATDTSGSGQYIRRLYTFRTMQVQNNPPVFGSPSPANGSTTQPLSLTWSIPINDQEGDTFTWSIQCSNGQTNGGSGATNGTKTLALSGLVYSTTYRVWVNAIDPTGSGQYSRQWYTFTTLQPNNPPMFGTPSPANGSTGNSLSLTWGIPISDPEGDSFNWSIQCSNGQTNSGSGVSNGTKALSLSGLTYLTTYKVWVNATDPAPGGSGLYTRRWYTFKTYNIVYLNPDFVLDNTNTNGSNHTLDSTELSKLVSSDNNRYRSYGQWASSYGNNKRIEFNFPDIPNNATVINVTFKFEWNITKNNGNPRARLRIYNGFTLFNDYSLPTPLLTVDRIDTIYLSSIINTTVRVNGLKIWFQAYQVNSPYTCHDWVQVSVTYSQ